MRVSIPSTPTEGVNDSSTRASRFPALSSGSDDAALKEESRTMQIHSVPWLTSTRGITFNLGRHSLPVFLHGSCCFG
jgi:hypothetical protein